MGHHEIDIVFWGLAVCGGVVLGIGPAWKAVNEQFYLHGFEYKDITISESWQMFKQSFLRGNQLFGLFFGLSFFA